MLGSIYSPDGQEDRNSSTWPCRMIAAGMLLAASSTSQLQPVSPVNLSRVEPARKAYMMLPAAADVAAVAADAEGVAVLRCAASSRAPSAALAALERKTQPSMSCAPGAGVRRGGGVVLQEGQVAVELSSGRETSNARLHGQQVVRHGQIECICQWRLAVQSAQNVACKLGTTSQRGLAW